MFSQEISGWVGQLTAALWGGGVMMPGWGGGDNDVWLREVKGLKAAGMDAVLSEPSTDWLRQPSDPPLQLQGLFLPSQTPILPHPMLQLCLLPSRC